MCHRLLPLAVTAFAILAAFQLTSSPSRAAFDDSDGDGAIDLAEEIFGSDPSDPASMLETTDFFLTPFAVSCTDGLDNDGDGNVDADDGGCVDSDDGYPSDETELRLGSDPHDDDNYPEDSRLGAVLAATGYNLFLFWCADEEDNDADGLTDAGDPGCASLDDDGDGFDDFLEKTLGSDWHDGASEPEHVAINPGSCRDALDNDGDGATDAADDGCAAAPNDDLADAIVVASLPFSHEAKLVGITAEPGERQSDCSSTDEIGDTVWYRYTPQSNTHVAIEIADSDLIHTASVWREATLGLAEVACTTSYSVYFNAVPSRFAFAALAGDTYYIQVERFTAVELGDARRLRLHMEATSPPANDNVADAATVDGLPFTTSVDTIAASAEEAEPEPSCPFEFGIHNSVWYRFTPQSDMYVMADTDGSDYFNNTIAVYEVSGLASVSQTACGAEGFPLPDYASRLAFHAQGGRTYYFQAATTGSLDLDTSGGRVQLNVESFALPTCAPSSFSINDPIGDADPEDHVDVPMDISSVSMGFDDANVCVTIGLSRPADPAVLNAELEIDTDGRGRSAAADYISLWCSPTGLGVDLRAVVRRADEGLLARVYPEPDIPPGSIEPVYFVFSTSSYTFIVPRARLGESGQDLRMAVDAGNWQGRRGSWSTDCAPNGGNITCQAGVCAFAPFRNGDANCNGTADSIDAAIVLQVGAGLLDELTCPDAADVNGDGFIDSRDAALILQFGAGIIDRLPPPPPGPPFY